MPSGNETLGITPSERYLAAVSERTFLKPWSYPNVYRNQGKVKEGDGKELCDLLVVFGNTIVVFSDKDVAFKTHGHLETNWARWARKSHPSLRQAGSRRGALATAASR